MNIAKSFRNSLKRERENEWRSEAAMKIGKHIMIAHNSQMNYSFCCNLP